MALVIENLYKTFDGYVALDRINLSVDKAEFVCLLGPSGCGKTTLLRIIAGLLGADGGKISLDGRDLVNVPARDRGFGIVFQSYSLFPHMTIAQNIGYGLKIRNTPTAEIEARVSDLLETVKLAGFGHRYPAQLSGGTAAAGGDRPCAGGQPLPAVARRTALCAGRSGAGRTPAGAARGTAAPRHSNLDGDSRSGGGDEHGG